MDETMNKMIPSITREHGERVIKEDVVGSDRLFACWDMAHSDGSDHFHLAAYPVRAHNQSFRRLNWGGFPAQCAVQASECTARFVGQRDARRQ